MTRLTFTNDYEELLCEVIRGRTEGGIIPLAHCFNIVQVLLQITVKQHLTGHPLYNLYNMFREGGFLEGVLIVAWAANQIWWAT